MNQDSACTDGNTFDTPSPNGEKISSVANKYRASGDESQEKEGAKTLHEAGFEPTCAGASRSILFRASEAMISLPEIYSLRSLICNVPYGALTLAWFRDKVSKKESLTRECCPLSGEKVYYWLSAMSVMSNKLRLNYPGKITIKIH